MTYHQCECPYHDDGDGFIGGDAEISLAARRHDFGNFDLDAAATRLGPLSLEEFP